VGYFLTIFEYIQDTSIEMSNVWYIQIILTILWFESFLLDYVHLSRAKYRIAAYTNVWKLELGMAEEAYK
jgi:hypothetical protein